MELANLTCLRSTTTMMTMRTIKAMNFRIKLLSSQLIFLSAAKLRRPLTAILKIRLEMLKSILSMQSERKPSKTSTNTSLKLLIFNNSLISQIRSGRTKTSSLSKSLQQWKCKSERKWPEFLVLMRLYLSLDLSKGKVLMAVNLLQEVILSPAYQSI